MIYKERVFNRKKGRYSHNLNNKKSLINGNYGLIKKNNSDILYVYVLKSIF